MSVTPDPGEVWMVAEKQYGDESWKAIHELNVNVPFIVTYLTACRIGFVTYGNDTQPLIGTFQRGQFEWGKQMVRIFPPVPTWDELEERKREVVRHSGDLRTQALAGAA